MTRSTKQHRATINTGIQANTVTAEVMAVGERAKATKIAGSSAVDRELPGLVTELRGALDRLSLQAPARQAIEEEVVKLDKAAAGKERSPERIGGILESITGKLKMVGTIVSEAVEIAGPLSKIAGLFGLPVPW